MKPRLKIVAGRPVTVPAAESPALVKARQRHGKPFAHEPGSDWKQHETPILTQWLQKGGAKQ